MTLASSVPTRRGGVSKANPARLRKFIGFVNAGLTLGRAAAAVGVHDTTRNDWMRRGRTELVRLRDSGIDPLDLIDPSADGWPTDQDWSVIPPGFNPYEWPYVLFALAVEKALATFEARQLALVQAAARGTETQNPQWQAAAWLLERRFPHEYGRAEARLRQQLDVTVAPAGGDRPLSVEDLEAALLALPAAGAEE